MKQGTDRTGGTGRDTADKEEEEEEVVVGGVGGVFFLKEGKVTLLSSSLPISCSLCFWSRSRATLT